MKNNLIKYEKLLDITMIFFSLIFLFLGYKYNEITGIAAFSFALWLYHERRIDRIARAMKIRLADIIDREIELETEDKK